MYLKLAYAYKKKEHWEEGFYMKKNKWLPLNQIKLNFKKQILKVPRMQKK